MIIYPTSPRADQLSFAPRPRIIPIIIMLRRNPTAITLTSEDVAAYEESRRAASSSTRMAENANPNEGPGSAGGGGSGGGGGGGGAGGEGGSGVVDPNDELKPLPGDKARIVRTGGSTSREERILGR